MTRNCVMRCRATRSATSSPSLVTTGYPPSNEESSGRPRGWVPTRSWQRLSAGAGAKGPRVYAWAWVDIADTAGQHRWLLIRKNTTGELVFYRCFSPVPVALAELVRVAGTRWAVEECFETAKDQVGLDQYQVRGWTGWHRFITLAMLALAALTVMALKGRSA